ALIAAESLGVPGAMKINSPEIFHKSDVSGVRLNIREPRSVRTAFREMMEAVAIQVPGARLEGVTVEPMSSRPHAREIMVGIVQDPVFGPVIKFGASGVAVELFDDAHVALPPLNEYLTKRLIEGTRMAQFLRKFRNFPEANLGPLVEVLQRISEMACELPEILELDINPLLVDEQGVIALDARIRVGHPKTSIARYDHMAI
ncbi:MAG: acetate--CoA ligase family protein, partial [Gammaproteobacteria bacterium]|nr:acetate--CoA ligase family protein [Gammaproteobacteria bacterium]